MKKNNFAVKIENPEQSRKVQEKLFELGYRWKDYDDTVVFTRSSLMEIGKDEFIHACSMTGQLDDGCQIMTYGEFFDQFKEGEYLPERFAVKLLNQGHSEAVQKRLFELGYVVRCGDGEFLGTRKAFCVFIDKDFEIQYWREEDSFNNRLPFVTIHDLYTLKRKPEFKEVDMNTYAIKENFLVAKCKGYSRENAIEMAKKILEVYGESK